VKSTDQIENEYVKRPEIYIFISGCDNHFSLGKNCVITTIDGTDVTKIDCSY